MTAYAIIGSGRFFDCAIMGGEDGWSEVQIEICGGTRYDHENGAFGAEITS